MDENKQRSLPLYKVILRNDDVNSVDKVVASLAIIAGIPVEEAVQKALETHMLGSSYLGSWHHELAETIMVNLNRAGLTTILDKEMC